jgi:Uma2 family endonuclease
MSAAAVLAPPEAKRLLTTDDVDKMGGAADGFELVNGVLVEKHPSHLAGYSTSRFATEVGLYLREHPVGYIFGSESMYRLGVRSPRTGRKPDASVVLKDDLPDGKIPDTNFHGRPTLAFESISPGDTGTEIERKLSEYIEAGVPLIWVLYPQNRIGRVVHGDGSTRLLTESDAFDGGDVLPGLRVELAAILPPPDRVREPAAGDE